MPSERCKRQGHAECADSRPFHTGDCACNCHAPKAHYAPATNPVDDYTMRHLWNWSADNVRADEYDAWIDYVLGKLVEDFTLVDLGWSHHYRAFITVTA